MKTRTTTLRRETSGHKLLINRETELQDFVNAVRPAVGYGMERGYMLGKGQRGAIVPFETRADKARKKKSSSFLSLPHVARAVDRISLRMAAGTLKTTEEDLARIFKKSAEEGLGVDWIAEEIGKKFDKDYDGFRSQRMARTEMTGIIGEGQRTSFEEDGVQARMWVATFDDRTRDAHADADRETHRNPVPLNEEYVLVDDDGSEWGAQYPGDQNLPASLRMNCRCTEVSADLKGKRVRGIVRLFIREHSYAERYLRRQIRIYFKRQLARIEEKL